jgi:hypothetical protein
MQYQNWEKEFHLLGSTAHTSLVKLLLQDLGTALGRTPLDLYRGYLSATINLNVNHNRLSSAKDSVLSRFFRESNEIFPPRYLDIDNTKQLAQLENSIGVRIVLARPPRKNGQYFMRIHDRTIYEQVLDEPPRRTFFFAVDFIGGRWHLFRSNDDTRYPEWLRNCESFICDWSIMPMNPRLGYRAADTSSCLVERISSLFDPREMVPHEHTDVCTTLRHALRNRKEIFRLLGGSRPVVLAAHVRSRLTVKVSLRCKDQKFVRLGYFRDTTLPPPQPNHCSVVVIKIDGSVYLPRQDFRDSIFLTTQCEQGGGNYPRSEAFPWSSGGKKGKRVEKPKPPDDMVCACENAVLYKNNLDSDGRQRLFRTEMNSFQLLEFLGMSSEENVAAIREASRKSACYYDAESCNYKAKSEDGMDEEFEAELFQPITDFGKPRAVLGTQLPILIGVVDGHDLAENLEPTILSCARGDHDTLVSNFLDLLLEKREIAVTIKHGLLADLFAQLTVIKEGFFSCFVRGGHLPRDYAAEPEELASSSSSSASKTKAKVQQRPHQPSSSSSSSEDSTTDEDDDKDDFDKLCDPVKCDADREVKKMYRHRAGWRKRKNKLERRNHAKRTRLKGHSLTAARIEARLRADQIAKAKLAFSGTIFGKLETNLYRLANCYYVLGFNSQG